ISRAEIDFALKVIEESLQAALGSRSEDESPRNAYTRRLYESSTWKRAWNYWWRSSPEEWLQKGLSMLGAKRT
ncbi:MAG TPA: hypothetical protein VGJ09_10000, partial [Bryobacteraceae bacterium]